MIIGTKTNIPVSTLTENCWKTCDYFDVDITRFYGNGSPYFMVCACKNLNLCKHAVDAFTKDGVYAKEEET